MKAITDLALDLLTSVNSLDDVEFEIAGKAIENTLELLYKHGYTFRNMNLVLTAEYDRMNKQYDDEIAKEFFG